MNKKSIKMFSVLFVVFLFCLPCILHAAIITTDYPGYAEGETITIIGLGWQPLETISLILYDNNDLNTPYYTFNNIQTDNAGNFINSEYIVKAVDEGKKFTLIATGQDSGSAQTIFDDVPHLHLFEDISHNMPRDAFQWGSTVFARADDLGTNRPCWQVRWIDPNNNLIATHNLSVLTSSRDDSFNIPELGPSGTWRAELYRPSSTSSDCNSVSYSLRDTLFFDVAKIVVIGAKDAYITNQFPNFNSNSGAFILKLDVNEDPKETEKTFIRFDFPILPAENIISAKVRMRLVYNPTLINPRTYNIHRITSPWNADTITWNNQPNIAALPTDSKQTPTGTPLFNNPMYWDVTNDMIAFDYNQFTNYGWRISDAEFGDPQGVFWSTEANEVLGTKTFGPVLLVDTEIAIPTITEWGILIFSIIAGFCSIYFLKKDENKVKT